MSRCISCGKYNEYQQDTYKCWECKNGWVKKDDKANKLSGAKLDIWEEMAHLIESGWFCNAPELKGGKIRPKVDLSYYMTDICGICCMYKFNHETNYTCRRRTLMVLYGNSIESVPASKLPRFAPFFDINEMANEM